MRTRARMTSRTRNIRNVKNVRAARALPGLIGIYRGVTRALSDLSYFILSEPEGSARGLHTERDTSCARSARSDAVQGVLPSLSPGLCHRPADGPWTTVPARRVREDGWWEAGCTQECIPRVVGREAYIPRVVGREAYSPGTPTQGGI